jgi:glycerol-3-phosphate dehydrogenase subunit C
MVLVTGRDTAGPWGKILAARALLKGEALDDELYDSVYQSTRCKACENVCPEGIKITEIIQALRHDLILDGCEPETHSNTAGNISRLGNPPGLPPEERLSDVEIPELRCGAEYLYLTGCWVAYRMPEVARDTMELLQRAGVDFTMLGRDEFCCGIFQIDTGHLKEAAALAKKNIEMVESTGVKAIVTSCPSCANVYNNIYPKLYRKPRFDVLTVPQLLHALLKEDRIKIAKTLSQTFTYKDPCHLGRTGGCYDEPRELITATGARLVEMRDTREQAICCAAPAGVRVRYPDITASVEKHILSEAKKTGAEAMVTSCPFCFLNFKQVSEDFEVVDIAQLVRKQVE